MWAFISYGWTKATTAVNKILSVSFFAFLGGDEHCDHELSEGGKGLLSLPGYSLLQGEVKAGAQDRDLETGTEAEPHMNAGYSLAIQTHVLLSFMYLSGKHAQRQGLPQWAEPFHINHKPRKYLTDLPIGQFDGDIFSSKVSSS